MYNVLAIVNRYYDGFINMYDVTPLFVHACNISKDVFDFDLNSTILQAFNY